MKLEISFNEFNALIQNYTKRNISIKPLPEKDSFAASIVVGIFAVDVPLIFDRVIEGHKLAFNYRLPFGMNRIAGKFKDTLSELIPGRIAEIDYQQIIVHLTRVKTMERYFEHFEVSHFESDPNTIQLQGKLKEQIGYDYL